MRVGIGYDIHRLKKGRKLVLGGVAIPYPRGLEGHSDGDALLHAVTDALLGAAGLGDLGEHFSDKSSRYKGADSRMFLRAVLALVKKKKLKVSNVDTTVIAEQPSLSAYKKRITASIAGVIGIAPSQVNVKAKTHEGLGPVGKGRAIACQAVVTLLRRSKGK